MVNKMLKTAYTFDDIAKAWFAGFTGWAALAGFFGHSSTPAKFRAIEAWTSLPVLVLLVMVCAVACADIKMNPHHGIQKWLWISGIRKWVYFIGGFCLAVPLFSVSRMGVDWISIMLYLFASALSIVMGLIDGHRGREGDALWL